MQSHSLVKTWVSGIVFDILNTYIYMTHLLERRPAIVLTVFFKAKNEKFMTSALEHIEQTLICAEIIRLLPKSMTS